MMSPGEFKKACGQPYRTIEVTPLGGALGAEIAAGDLRAMTREQYLEIRRAWLQHHVIRFRGLDFTDGDLVAFSRNFGQYQPSSPNPNPAARDDLDKTATKKRVVQAPPDERYPEISVVSNIIDDGVALGTLGDGELVWHSDQSSFPAPPSATMLYAIEVPVGQGQTGFLNAHLAYDALPESTRSRVGAMRLKHDSSFDSAGYLRPGLAPVTDVRTSPGLSHPLVCTHPESGRNSLFLGRRPHAYIEGLSIQESEALLDELWAHIAQDRFVWWQEWEPGDLIIWDNRSVMHRRDAFDPRARRLLHRVMIKGTPPRFGN
jgi:taurine dioxygenase